MTDAVQVAREECEEIYCDPCSSAIKSKRLLDAYRAALLADVRAAVEAMPTFTVTGAEYRVIRYVDRDAIGAVLDAMALGA